MGAIKCPYQLSALYSEEQIIIIPSLLRAVISLVKSATYPDFENEVNIENIGGSVR